MARISVVALSILVASACSSSEDFHQLREPVSKEISTERPTVIVNATVYTVDESNPVAEAFGYNADGVIFAVGAEADVLAAAGDDPEIIDAGGAFVMPGFQDAHVHVPEAGLNLDTCFMEGDDLDDLFGQAVGWAQEQPDSDWVRAAGVSLFALRDSIRNPLDVLDEAIPDRPALILDDLGHAVWTNTLGLEAAGIESNDVDPQGDVFHRNASGHLTGLLLEDAQQLVRNAAAESDEAHYQGLLAAQLELAKNGVTTISDAGGYWAQNHPAAFERSLAEETLTVRAMNTLYVYPALNVDEQLAEFERRFSADSDWLQFNTAKLYVDGILDLGTALMVDPYDVPLDQNYPSGFSYFTDEQLAMYVSVLHRMGYKINFHAIGDRGVRHALDSIEALGQSDDVFNRGHRITHTYLVHDDDLGRFAKLGMIADFQQGEDSISIDYHDYLANYIGDRAYDLLPTGALDAAGARVILSSDWDADELPPLGTIERSLTRESNAIDDIATAIYMHTVAPANALGHGGTNGSIAIDKFADYVVLDRDITTIEVGQIDEARVVMTVVGGRIVFERTRND